MAACVSRMTSEDFFCEKRADNRRKMWTQAIFEPRLLPSGATVLSAQPNTI